jgi:uncharacterized protein YlbG (UPF0298 family)
MFGDIHTRRPPKNFSLLYLDNNEVHLMFIKVNFLIDAGCEE